MVVFSPAFDLVGGQNVEVRLAMPLANRWAYVATDLVEESTGVLRAFEGELSAYSGYEGGEAWSEGDGTRTHVLPAVERGRYVLRLEVQQPAAGALHSIDVRVRQGVFRARHLLAAALFVLLPGLLLLVWQWSFERRRWSQSDHAPAWARGGSE
jgi:hypothetical protein